MKKNPASQSAPARLPAREDFRSSLLTRRSLARRLVGEGGFFNLRVLIGLLVLLAGVFLELFATANSSTGRGVGFWSSVSAPAAPNARLSGKVTGQASFMRVTPEGVVEVHNLFNSEGRFPAPVPRKPLERGEALALGPEGTTLWSVDDELAIAESVAIDDLTVWGAWSLNTPRLSAHPIVGDGTPDFEFASPDLLDLTFTQVASARGADRILFLEHGLVGFEQRQRVHSFTSQSDGTPDWSFEFPLFFGEAFLVRRLAVSHDGSTAAATFRDSVSTLYVFDTETGEVTTPWTDPDVVAAVDLTDDGSLALVTQQNRATLLDTATGDVVFQTNGAVGVISYRISGDGHVLVVSGFERLQVYAFDGTSYQKVIDFTRPGYWFGGATAVSRDGSTVGTFAIDESTGWLEGEVFLFDVASGELLGSRFFSGNGSLQGTAADAASSDDGSVMAFASWGTQFHDWPEVMVFNRDVELIGAISFPGSAFSVDVTADGRFVVGGAKAVHANQTGNGGRIELIEIALGPTPTPTATPTPAATPTATPTPIPTATPRPTPTPRLRPSPAPRPTPPR